MESPTNHLERGTVMNYAPSEARLCEIKDVTETDAKLIRAVWKARGHDELHTIYPRAGEFGQVSYKLRELKRLCIDQIIRTYGVEYLGTYKPSGEHCYYCNSGDACSTTVLFIGNRMDVGCWGDLVERNKIRVAGLGDF